MTEWEQVLAGFGDHLDAVEEALDGRDALPVWQPPSSLTSPLPATLATQARALLDRSHTLERRYSERLEQLRNSLRATAPSHDEPREHAQILDRRA